MLRPWLILFTLIALLTLSLHPASAVRTRLMNLNSIIDSAAIIFEGECIAARTGHDPESNFLATWYTFRVDRPIKGDLGKEFILKQFGGSEGDEHMPSPAVPYEIGEKLVLFVYGKSDIGFSSAVGLHQGKFMVREFESGGKFVTNGMPGRVLFDQEKQELSTLDAKGMKIQGQDRLMSERLDLQEFISHVQKKVREEQTAEK